MVEANHLRHRPNSPDPSPKIDSDRKRNKKSVAISSIDCSSEKHDKKAKMSSSTSSRDKVRASHILIKHQGSRHKESWKDPEGRIISTTTRAATVSQLKALRDHIDSCEAKFEDVAASYSDCSLAKT